VIANSKRPLTARSVLASTLLGVDPPELPVAYLVHVAGLFGIGENRARVALSRMVASGEVITDGSGSYRLVGRLLDRQDRQRVSRAGRSAAWTGGWHLAVVVATGSTAAERAARRTALAFARLAELREGVWTRPDNLDVRLDDPACAGVHTFVATPVEDPAVLARRLWDLDGWAAGAAVLMDAMRDLPPRTPEDLADGFVLSAAVLRHLQADPLLPERLLAPSWPGAELRTRYDAWDARYRDLLARWSHGG